MRFIMPYRRKDSPIWCVSYTNASGCRVRRATGTTSLRKAKALEAKWHLEAHRQKKWDEQPNWEYDELMVRYLNDTEKQKRSAARDRDIAKHLTRKFRDRVLSSLGAKDIKDYVEMRRGDKVMDSTVHLELSLLSAAINYARHEWEWEIPNPATGRKPGQGEGRVRWITHEEAARFIAAASTEPRSPHLPDFLQLGFNTGCRSQEMLGLKWGRVDLKNRLIYLDAEHSKDKKRASVPLNKGALAASVGRSRYRDEHCLDSPWVFCNKFGERIQSGQALLRDRLPECWNK
jgi:integrase